MVSPLAETKSEELTEVVVASDLVVVVLLLLVLLVVLPSVGEDREMY